MELYTMEQWRTDQTFKAQPGQEIAAAVYEEMFNCMPPKTLPREKALQVLHEYNLPVHAGFLMGEPHSSGKQGELYLSFGMNDYGKGKHYFYLGLSGPVKEIADGSYYFMDTLTALDNDGFFRAEDFTDDADAIRAAANYEATLYKYEYRSGQRISSSKLYEPRFY